MFSWLFSLDGKENMVFNTNRKKKKLDLYLTVYVADFMSFW